MLSLFRNRPIARRRRQRRRRNRTSGRVSRPSLVICSAEVTTRRENWPLETVRFCHVPGGSFRPGATPVNGVKIIGRRCCLSGIAIVISPPAPTSRADESNVGEEIGRSATSIAAPLCFPPADVAEQAEQTDARTSRKGSRLFFGLATVIFPAELTARKDGTRRGPKICTERYFGIVA